MLVDVALLVGKLTPLSSESGGSIASLETLVKDKATPRKHVGQAVAGLLRRSGSTKSESGDGGQINGDQSAEVEEPVDMGDEEDSEAQPAADDVPHPETEQESSAILPEVVTPEQAESLDPAERQPVQEASDQPTLTRVDSSQPLVDESAATESTAQPTALETRAETIEAPVVSEENGSAPSAVSEPTATPTEAQDTPVPSVPAPVSTEKGPATPTKPLPPLSTGVERKLSLAERLRGVATARPGRSSVEASPVSERGG